MTPEQDRLIREAMKDPDFRIRLAGAMVSPLRTTRGYRTVNGRQVPTDAKFACEHCGTWSDDEGYEHSDPECDVAYVLLS